MWQRLFIFFLFLSGLSFALEQGYVRIVPFAHHYPIEGVVVLSGQPTTSAFDETGTIAFYPNNAVAVPYLFYTDARGHTAAKTLIFPAGAPLDFASWSGAHVRVIGTEIAEYVAVDNIVYIAGP